MRIRPRALALTALLLAAVPALPAQDQSSSAPAAPGASGVPSEVENSVVRVFATVRHADLPRPWTKLPSREIGGTGIVIEGHRILTNAHVVLYASQVQVQGGQSGDKVPATVEAIAPGIDLAVLKLDDETFFASRPALKRAADLPQVKDPVLVYGFPTGGTNLSITKGIVSRIEFVPYNYDTSGLRVQIDAAINPGNSGGPAMAGDKVVGLAYSRLAGAQNIGYLIPSEEIELFLRDVADGRYDGKPALFDDFQSLESPGLRGLLKLGKDVHGVVVREPLRSDPDYPLKPWDVVVSAGGTPIDDQGMVLLPGGARVRFGYLVQKLARDGRLTLGVIRGGGLPFDVQVPVGPNYPKLIPFLQGGYPSYFIYGPIVFAAATEDFVAAMSAGPNAAIMTVVLSETGSPLLTRRSDRAAFEGEQLVVVPSPLFPHRLSQGSFNPQGKVVRAINGIPVRNLRHLVEMLRDAKDAYVTIEFAGRGAPVIVLPRAEAAAATDEILNDNGIRSQGSPELMAVWQGKP